MLIFNITAMKKNKILSILGLIAFISLSGCSPEDDIKNPYLRPMIFMEDFSAGAADNTELDTPRWENIAEVGATKWKAQVYSGNAYAEFTPFQSTDVISIGWLVSPKIDMDAQEGEKLEFIASQSYVSNSANSLEVLIATDYDGTNLTTANWQSIGAMLPSTSSTYFEFIKSGVIDLSTYTGSINIAFKVKGSGTNTALDGGYQIDDIRIYNN
jgi:hypothetical protein